MNVPTQEALELAAPGRSAWNDVRGHDALGHHGVGTQDVDGQLGDTPVVLAPVELERRFAGAGLTAPDEAGEGAHAQ